MINQHSPNLVIAACVLAAGTSSRFGTTKLIQPFQGKPLVQHALLAVRASSNSPVYLVVGHDQQAVIDAAAGLCDNILLNGDYQDGIGTSIAAGAKACRDRADAILIVLADQPLVTAKHLRDLIDTWSGDDNEIVASSFDGLTCPPILFPRNAFDALAELCGDTGARSLLANDEFVVKCIDFPPAGLDIDSQIDLDRLNRDYPSPQ